MRTSTAPVTRSQISATRRASRAATSSLFPSTWMLIGLGSPKFSAAVSKPPAGGQNGTVLPLVGRAPVVAALRRAVADTRAGRGRFVLLAGEPGIGKTALAADAARDAAAQGATVVWGVCVEGGGVPLYR